MNITFSQVSYLLSRNHIVAKVKNAYSDASLISVKRYRGTVEKGQLYSIPVARVSELNQHLADTLKECGFVAWGSGNPEEKEKWQKLFGKNKGSAVNIIFVEGIEFEEDLQEELVDIFLNLHLWQERLRGWTTEEQINLPEILNDAKKIIGRPMAIFDRNFILLGVTDDYLDYFPEMRTGLHNQQIGQTDIRKLLNDEDYLNAEDKKDVFIYPTEPAPINLLCYNYRLTGEFSARVMMVMPEFDVHRGLKQLYEFFVRQLERIYLNNLKNFPADSQNDTLHLLFEKYLFHSRRKDYETDFNALKMYNWDRNDEFQIIVLQMFGTRQFERGASYLCQQLERVYKYSCTYRTDREIIWIINYTRESGIKDKKRLFDDFPYIIRDFGCKAGVSDFFNDFVMLSNYRRQADIALELGNKKKPTNWYYSFGDYALEYMLGQMNNLFTTEQLCHKGLKKLYDYDMQHDTEFVKTLYYYISNQFNASEASAKLYIHRTTFIRRMEKMEQMVPLKLDDPDELLHILLSFRMLLKNPGDFGIK